VPVLFPVPPTPDFLVTVGDSVVILSSMMLPCEILPFNTTNKTYHQDERTGLVVS